jgi:hypothetical protein
MPLLPDGHAALFIAHPGHELRVYGWLETARPRTFVLTDGTGRSANSRLHSTLRILDEAGGSPGSVCGRFSDLAVYEAILRHDYQMFTGLVHELADEFVCQQISYVVGDATEGYNTAHDICRLVLNAAVEEASRARGVRVGNYDFLLKGRPEECPARLRDRAIWLRLNDDVVGRKLKAAYNYPELSAEVEAAISKNGESAFRVECLRPVDCEDGTEPYDVEKPYYEVYGEQQVASGYYDQVIRYREHILPLARALRECVGRRG